jgi:2-hydroxyacyl-CoA lyase 1
MASTDPTTGAHIIARTLRDLGVTAVFGLIGVPVTEIAEECINLGIRFIGLRNEQAASYAATGYGYLTGKPGVLLLVGGPGVLHGMAGVSYSALQFNHSMEIVQIEMKASADFMI